MWLKCNRTKDHFTDYHDDVPQGGVWHSNHVRSLHVRAAIHSCIIITARREPLTQDAEFPVWTTSRPPGKQYQRCTAIRARNTTLVM